MKKILLGFFLMALFLSGASASVVEMGGDIQARGLYRNNFDLTGETGGEDWVDSYLRVFMLARPYPDVKAYIRMIVERDWGTEEWDDSSTSFDLDLGYIELAKLWTSRADVTLGRQELLYGEGFLIGRNDRLRTAKYERSPRKAFDALKVSWDFEPFAFDMFGSVIEEYYDEDGAALYGVNLNYDYFDEAALDIGIFMADYEGDSRTLAFSARGEANVARFPGLRVKAELAPQIGKHSSGRDLSALGGYAGVKYLFAHQRMSCVPHYAYFNYYYLSGDDGTGDFGGFDPMFNDMFFGEINAVNELLSLDTNARIMHLGFGWNVSRAVDLEFNLYGFQRARDVAGTRDFGQEVDVKLVYRYNPDTEFIITSGYFSPKSAFAEKNAMQLTAALKLAF